MAEGGFICGAAIEPACPAEVEVKEIAAFDFLVWFIDNIADLIVRSTNPKIEVGLLQQKENAPLQVIIRPTDIDNVHIIQTSRRFALVLDIYTSETVARNSFALLLATGRICISVIHTVANRKGFIYVPRFTLVNLNQARIQVVVTKSV